MKLSQQSKTITGNLNNAHNGTCLRQALYKVMQCASVTHKVGYVTYDNTTNNDTMMQEFADCIRSNTGTSFNPKKHHLECSLAKCKELFWCLQMHTDDSHEQQTTPLQLLIDMKVCWSSMFPMLHHALDLKKYAERAQHAFSTEQGPTLHSALPALEVLHKAWSICMASAKYHEFTSALDASLTKVSKCYEQTATSNAHIMAMMLDPAQKLNHIHMYWEKSNLQK
ncbi:hypothetical protein EDC04DRAFT_2605903 [Pisolithus marmoratus]|nr:hypothetical protein EDC04DRAFT_2605903 [Pisolithus marmoratus]